MYEEMLYTSNNKYFSDVLINEQQQNHYILVE